MNWQKSIVQQFTLIIDSFREERIMDLKQQYPRATNAQLDYFNEFLASGTAVMIAQWVNFGMKETPLELGYLLEKMKAIWLRALDNISQK